MCGRCTYQRGVGQLHIDFQYLVPLPLSLLSAQRPQGNCTCCGCVVSNGMYPVKSLCSNKNIILGLHDFGINETH